MQEGVAAPLVNESGVLVEAGKVVVGSKTFIAKNITSVRAEYGRKGSVVSAVAFAAIAFALCATTHWIIGVVAILFAFASMQRSPSKLYITTAGGEAMALQHADSYFVRRVHDAAITVSSR
jgi:hypothetical protein